MVDQPAVINDSGGGVTFIALVVLIVLLLLAASILLLGGTAGFASNIDLNPPAQQLMQQTIP